VIVGLAAVAVAAAIAAWLSFSVEDTLRSATLLLVGPGLAALVAGLALRRPVGIPAAIFFLGLAYTLRLLAEEDALDQRAPFVAAALYATAELSYWSLELRNTLAEEAGAYLRRVGVLAGMTVGVLALGIALLALVDVLQAGGVAAEAVGVLAAVVTLALLALASRRPAS
jgi:hypothetical protein